MHRRGPAWQLSLRYGVVCIVAILALAWLAVWVFDEALTRSARSGLKTTADQIAADVPPSLAAEDVESIAGQLRQRSAATGARITLVRADGRTLFDSRDANERTDEPAKWPDVAAALAGRDESQILYLAERDKQVLLATKAIRSEGEIVGAVRVAKSAAELRLLERDVRQSILLAASAIGVLAVAVGTWLIFRSVGSVDRLAQQAQRLATGLPTDKLPRSEFANLAGLADSLNSIAVQLEQRNLLIGRQGHEQAAILASMTEGVLAVDADERIIALNSAATELLDAQQFNVQGRKLHEVLRNSDLRRFVARALQSPTPVEDDVVVPGNLSRGDRIFKVRGAALRGSFRGVGAVIVLDDVTHYRKLEDVRRDFVANVSHELKTPIASIKGFVETLLDGAMQQPDDAQRFLRIVANHAERLHNIVEDLLSLSKIEQSEEAANLPLDERPLRPLLEAAVAGCDDNANQRQVSVNLQCDPALTADVNPLLEQAVINLIDNAIKYSEAGKVVELVAGVAAGEVVISVTDRGCGIADEHLPRLFERFYRVDRARSRKLGGTGLGLAIVKHIVQAHRGRVSVTSTPGAGSTFAIHLPAPAGVRSEAIGIAS